MRSAYSLIAAALAAKAFAGPVAVADAELFARQDVSSPSGTLASATTTSRASTTSSVVTSQPITTTTRKTTTTKKKTTTTKKRTTTRKTTKTTAKPAAATASTYQQAVVYHHNYHRANHSAPPIQWSPKMASFARGIAESCVYAHNVEYGGGGYGQNIAAGAPLTDISNVITEQFYNNEVPLYKGLYGKNNPDMSNFHAWGHFSQVVWKGTTHVGCYTIDCSKRKGGLKNISNVYSNIAPLFTVCNYSPPGNYQGEYKNVGKSLNRATVNGNYRVNKQKIKQINPPAASSYKKKN